LSTSRQFQSKFTGALEKTSLERNLINFYLNPSLSMTSFDDSSIQGHMI